jgi:diguanylate cyclase (GGDEF)-like protein
MAILTVEDISLRRKAEDTMARLAYRDMLTDLPNRVSLQAALEIAFEAWQANKTPFAVIMMDLDGFKPVNDMYGHDAGDEVLQAIGARLANANRSLDLAARHGGDEFAIVLNDCANIEIAGQIAQRLIEAVALPIGLRNRETSVTVGASAGVAQVSDGDHTAEDVLIRADRALYAAKAAGKNCVKIDQVV